MYIDSDFIAKQTLDKHFYLLHETPPIQIAGYVIHKLCIHDVLEVYRKRRMCFREEGMTDEEMFQISVS